MHILIGVLVASVLIYWWARGSVILAIALTLVSLFVAGAGAGPVGALGVGLAWAPVGIRRYLLPAKVPA